MGKFITTKDYNKLNKAELIEYVQSLERLLVTVSDQDGIISILTSEISKVMFTHKHRCYLIDRSSYRINERLKAKYLSNG